MNDPEVARVLTLARSKVARRWTRGQSSDEYGGVCASEAINRSCIELMLVPYSEAVHRELLIGAMEIGQVGHHCNVPNWNDQPNRTKEEVLAAFDKAIERNTPKPEPVVKVEKRIIPAPIKAKMKELIGA